MSISHRLTVLMVVISRRRLNLHQFHVFSQCPSQRQENRSEHGIHRVLWTPVTAGYSAEAAMEPTVCAARVE